MKCGGNVLWLLDVKVKGRLKIKGFIPRSYTSPVSKIPKFVHKLVLQAAYDPCCKILLKPAEVDPSTLI